MRVARKPGGELHPGTDCAGGRSAAAARAERAIPADFARGMCPQQRATQVSVPGALPAAVMAPAASNGAHVRVCFHVALRARARAAGPAAPDMVATGLNTPLANPVLSGAVQRRRERPELRPTTKDHGLCPGGHWQHPACAPEQDCQGCWPALRAAYVLEGERARGREAPTLASHGFVACSLLLCFPVSPSTLQWPRPSTSMPAARSRTALATAWWWMPRRAAV